jgi:hypothetical protein
MQDLPAIGTPQYTQRMQMALSDPNYKTQWSNPNLNSPGAPVAGAKEGVANWQAGVKALSQDQSEISQAADTALQNFQAAKLIYDGNMGVFGGPLGAIAQKAAATLGVNINSVTGRQEVSKYLTQAAIAQLKQMYGSRPGVFDVKINMEQAFPNIEKMSPQAIRNLIDSQILQAQYLKQTAGRSAAYIQKGMDPWKFGTWNATYFPRGALLNQMYSNTGNQSGAVGKQVPSVGTVEKGYKFLGGDPSLRSSWAQVQ